MEGFVFQVGGGASFLSGECPIEGIGFDGGGSKKIVGLGGAPPCPTMGNPEDHVITWSCDFMRTSRSR